MVHVGMYIYVNRQLQHVSHVLETEDRDYAVEVAAALASRMFGGYVSSRFGEELRFMSDGEEYVYVDESEEDTEEYELDEYDDPQCVCGVYKSEHALMGCREGFQTADAWERERDMLVNMDDDTYERYMDSLRM